MRKPATILSIHRHRVFKGLAKRGKHSMGWFFGFKFHLVINHKGEIIRFCLTKGHRNDRFPVKTLLKNLKGLVAGDKGYLGKKLANLLHQQGLKLITKVRNNMKPPKLSDFEKAFLHKRGIVETVIDQLKAIYHIDHTRHHSPHNFLANFLAALALSLPMR